MMNYCSSHPGPTRTNAAKIISSNATFKSELQKDFIPNINKATSRIRQKIEQLIDNILLPDKILEILKKKNPDFSDDQCDFAGSDYGWMMYGKKDCENLIRKALKKQIDEYSRTIKKNSNMKVIEQAVRNPNHILTKNHLNTIAGKYGGKQKSLKKDIRSYKKKSKRKKNKYTK